jgi:hypothetical protein
MERTFGVGYSVVNPGLTRYVTVSGGKTSWNRRHTCQDPPGYQGPPGI